ncbi:hypothetical protein [Galbibacter pacificus]|uniref:Uncharacterized protein n=1 Tax=Galbibacter pacificus TaxID=2996052 RepID=A0ABT6FRK7_9FLAO|nr:hypothetical protein [Galbibacter pacificus]MDG3581769.1 hypothetical protein [Galbibacter pacificus]MDG3585757.1 hypothetical protein [Galbibacter pacificus]
MNRLINADDIKQYKDIGKKVDEEKINQIIDLAQDVDLRGLLNNDFYFEVINHKDEANYQDALTGSTFGLNGALYSHFGIKAILVDFFYARYVMQVNVNITPFGSTTKLSDDSEATPISVLKDIAKTNEQQAMAKWQLTKMYLDANKNLFQFWNTHTSTNDSSSNRLSFSLIGGRKKY